MEFRVLGPLSVVGIGGDEIGPGRGRQRALLAVLLVHANQTVSVDRIVDALWDDPPASAAHAVEVHVSELRRRLATAAGPRIETRPGGYAIRVAADELDARRFEASVGAARDAVALGDPAGGIALYLAGDALWRGAAFGELADAPFARPEAVRLEGLRAAARGERLDAQLAAGRQREVIGELQAMVTQEPWHEGLHAQLMLALYRDGRQAEALAAYRRLREALADELGIEPGPAVEGLQLAILRQDPAIAAPAPATPSPAAPPEILPSEPPASGPSAAASGPSAAADRHLGALERRLVSALVVDLVAPATAGATTARADPEVVRRAQRRVIDVVEAVARPLVAAIVPLIDGGVMAVFGANPAAEDHAERALAAAVDIRKRLTAGPNPAEGRVPVIVVDAGEVVIDPTLAAGGGMVGGQVGDLLLLRAVAPAGEILVGTRAAAAARRGHAMSDARRLVTRTGTIEARALVGPPVDVAERDDRPLLGRQPELDELARTWAAVQATGTPRLAVIMGDPGIGKSALVREATRRMAAEGVVIARGRCLAYGRGITYWPLAEVLRDRLDLPPELDPESTLERLGDRAILGLTLGLDAAPGLHPMAAQHRLHGAWVELLDAETARGPVVLVLEDLHWAEAPLIELAGTIVREVRGPLLVLTTARPEFASRAGAIESARHVVVRWLEPLSDDDAVALAADRLGGQLSPELRRVVTRAEGNPFFVEELVASLRDRGELTGSGGQPAPDAAPATLLPDTVRSVLESRVESLEPATRATLQAASVIGRRFDVALLDALVAAPSATLDELVRREFLRTLPERGSDGRPRYAFKHALTRDAAYETLTLERRARLHAALASHLESAAGGSTDHPAFVAYHYLEAVLADGADLAWDGEPEVLATLRARARRWAADAAAMATARYAIDEAVGLLARALACDPDREEAARLWLRIGRANVLRYDGVAFWSAMDAAIEAAGSDAERGAIYAELAFETAFRWAIWTRMPDRQLVDGWIDRALELAAPGTRGLAYGLVARSYWHPLEAGDAPEQAIRIGELLDDPVVLSYALDAAALTAFVAGDDRAAFARWERRTGLATRITDLDHLEDLYGAAIAGNAALGHMNEARRYAALHDEVAMQLSWHHQVHAVAMHLELEELAGGWERMVELTPRAEGAVAANLATPCVRNERSLLACALAAARTGDDAASRRLEQAADALGMQGYEAVFDPVRVRIAVTRGEAASIRARLPLRVPPPSKNWWRLTTTVAALEASLAIGDTAAVERDAGPLIAKDTLIAAFAGRAAGVARGDRELQDRAERRLLELGIDPDAALRA